MWLRRAARGRWGWKAIYGLAQGCGGDLVLVEAETVAEAVAQRPGRRTVVKRGRVVASDGVSLP